MSWPRPPALLGAAPLDPGPAMASAVVNWRRWCHRRVETVTFDEGTRARRRVSLDLSPIGVPRVVRSGVGGHVTQRRELLVPLTWVAKNTLIKSLDVEDDRRGSLPVLNLAARQDLAEQTLRTLVELDTDRSLDEAAQEASLLGDVVRHPAGEADDLARRLWRGLGLTAPMGNLMLRFAAADLLVVVMPGEELGRRQVVKYSYHQEAEPPSRPLSSLRAGLGLSSFDYGIVLGPVYTTRSFYLEVPAPPGLRVGVRFRPDPARASADDRLSAVGRSRWDAGWGTRPPEVADVRLYLAPSGQLASVALAAVGTATILWTALLTGALDVLAENAEATAALLLFAPALLVTFLARPGENVVSGAVFGTLRLSALLLGVLLFAAGASLVGQLEEPWRTLLWQLAAGTSSVLAVLLSTAWVLASRARRRRGRRRDR